MEKIFNYQDIESDKSLDTLYQLYEISKLNYDQNSFTIKKLEIDYKDGKPLVYFFFNKISENNKSVIKSVKNFLDKTYYGPEIEGLLFAKYDKVSKIKVPYYKDVFSVSVGIHEYTHALDVDDILSINSNGSLEECAPLLNQLLFLEYLSPKLYIDEVLKTTKKYFLNNQLFYNLNKFFNPQEFKYIGSNLFYDIQSKHYMYMLGSLYALMLYDEFKKDSSTFNEVYNGIYKGTETIESVLNFYDVSLENDTPIKLIKKLINDNK